MEFLLELFQVTDELEMMLDINTKEELKQLAEAHGYDDKSQLKTSWKISVSGAKKLS